MLFAIILFAATYVLMLALPKYRTYVALVSAACFILSGMLPLGKIIESIDFNVLLMISGTMGIVSLFIESKMPARLADLIIARVPNVCWAIIALSLFAGVISALVDNVATVLMVAPVALAVAERLGISPVPMIISIAVSSNLQGAATLVGDTTSILLGGYAGMNFLDFFVYKGRPSIFFAVELGALLSAVILYVLFRKEDAKLPEAEKTVVTDYVPTVLLVAMVGLLVCASFIPNAPSISNGVICVSLMLIGCVHSCIKKKSAEGLLKPLREIDFGTVLLLLGLFLVIGGITEQGVIDALAGIFARIGSGNVFVIYTLILWASVVFSAFIDNIPYVATMLPVVQGIAAAMGIDPTVLYFGLLSGATLGGNMTPIGASANITGIGILRKRGYEVKNSDFFRIGIPFTLAAVIPAYIYIWLVYGA
ncbi:MAG TPA: arsenic transporter [Candidatus Ruthenibacterium merdigallinarum]|nr:arsenic transporter [Candidatus Ruthenibacterium merdigallinarum]